MMIDFIDVACIAIGAVYVIACIYRPDVML